MLVTSLVLSDCLGHEGFSIAITLSRRFPCQAEALSTLESCFNGVPALLVVRELREVFAERESRKQRGRRQRLERNKILLLSFISRKRDYKFFCKLRRENISTDLDSSYASCLISIDLNNGERILLFS